LELIKDYVCNSNYHSSKANAVTDALSKKSSSMTMVAMFIAKKEILLDMERFGIEMVGDMYACLSSLVVKPIL
jgi:hypothetical protein